jgi:hypothetical protein
MSRASPVLGVVVAVCTLEACQSQAAAPTPAAPDAPQAVSPQGVSEAEQPDAAQTGQVVRGGTSSEVPSALRELLATQAWSAFRNVWKQIDAVPSSPIAPSPSGHWQGVERMVEAAHAALDEVEREPAARSTDPAVLPTLRRLVALRGSVLTGLEFRLMVSHRMPSRREMALSRGGTLLEQRIDAYLSLRARKELEAADAAAALGAIRESICLLVALQQRHADPHLYMSVEQPDGPAETLAELEALVQARREKARDGGSDEALSELEAAIAEARRLAPLFDVIVADLVR